MSFLNNILNFFSIFKSEGQIARDPKAWSESGSSVIVASTKSGQSIDQNKALSLAAYYACIRNIAEDIGKLPYCIYIKDDKSRLRASDHYLDKLVTKMVSPFMSSQVFRETMIFIVLSWGNAYAQILRNNAGDVAQLWPIHPSMVTPYWDNARNELIYIVRNANNQKIIIEAKNMIHIKGLGFSGLQGISMLQYIAETIGLGIAAQDFGSSYFANGSRPGGIIEYDKILDDQAVIKLRDGWNKMYGNADSAHKVAVLEQGMKFTPLAIPQKEAQFLETRMFQVEEIARWFRMPLHKIQHLSNTSYSSQEQADLEYTKETLLTWVVRLENEMDIKLLGIDSPYYTKINLNALLRADSVNRSNYYRTMISTGTMSPNEARMLEDMNPIESEAGDSYFIQGAMTTLEVATSGQNYSSSSSGINAMPLLSDACFRCARREFMAIINKPNTDLGSKYAEQSCYMLNQLTPLFISLNINKNLIEGAVHKYSLSSVENFDKKPKTVESLALQLIDIIVEECKLANHEFFQGSRENG